MNINTTINHLAIAWENKEIGMIVRKHIICKDGFELSVQASKYHYCFPRRTQKYYQEFEIMCDISMDKPLLEKYFEGSVCPYVPAVVIEKLILRHGGINWKLTPRKEKKSAYSK